MFRSAVFFYDYSQSLTIIVFQVLCSPRANYINIMFESKSVLLPASVLRVFREKDLLSIASEKWVLESPRVKFDVILA